MKNEPRKLVFKGKNGKWFFHLQAANGKIIFQSQGYKTKQGALKGIRAIETVFLKAPIVIKG